MEDLSEKFDSLKLKYRHVFLETVREIQESINILKPENFNGEIFDKYDEGSLGQVWQKDVISLLENNFQNKIVDKLSEIRQNYKKCNCIGCGVCCKLACSEFSFEELQLKAKYGDKFAQQFVQTFVPYDTLEEAVKIYPEYLKMLEDKNETGYYFYHCPKVTTDNQCPDYENRPQICRDFPDNPIAFLPLTCGYNDWKLKSEPIALKLNAMAEIINFYIDKIKGTSE